MKGVLVRVIVLLGLAGLLAGGRALLPEPAEPADPYAIGLAEVRAFPEVLWVDGRERGAYERGHHAGAIHLDPGGADYGEGLMALLSRWDPSVPVVVYCDDKGCGASRELAEKLRGELGVDSIYWLEGGWESMQKGKGGQ